MNQKAILLPKNYTNKLDEINKSLQGYFQKDSWDIEGEELQSIVGEVKNKARKRYVNFSKLNESLRKEMKYWLLIQIKSKMLSGLTLLDYSARFQRLNEFINKYYANIESFSQIDYDKGYMQWKTYLVNQGIKNNASYRAVFGVVEYILNFYDDREEFEKEIWDFRKIPQSKITSNTSVYLLSFKSTPQEFKSTVKAYIKIQVTSHSLVSLKGKILGLNLFLNYYKREKPYVNNFIELNRQDIEKYLVWFRSKYPNNSPSFVTQRLIPVREFLIYLQSAEYKQAPKRPIAALFFDRDFPINKVNKNKIKWIPEKVLDQLKQIINTNPQHLNPPMVKSHIERVPIVILLLATGWRISDILNLRYDKCLVQINNNWYIQGDISKTDVLDHRVPIEEEVAILVKALIQDIELKSTELTNPNKYLFPCLSGKRVGKCQRGANVSMALNRWAIDYNIIGEDNKIYHFANHAFRHTKGVELINSGMNILHIQKWLAHASPEMTLIYAKVTDQTMRNEWIKANEDKQFFKVNVETGILKEIADEDLIEWEYIKSNLEAAKVPLGYCMASKKQSCPYVETPCLNCNNFCTTPENLPEFEVEIKNLNELIERTKDMPIWNEKNQKRQLKLTEIKDKLQKGQIHHPAGKKARENLK